MIIKTDWKGTDAITADEMNRIEGNILQNSHISGSKYATIVIGTSQSGYTEKDVDFLCDGTDDHVEINEAIQSLANGGEILILEGIYNIGAVVDVNEPNIHIRGTGEGTILKRQYNNVTAGGFIKLRRQTFLSYVNVHGNGAYFQSENNHGVETVLGGASGYIGIDNIYAAASTGSEVYMETARTVLSNSMVNGVIINSSHCVVQNCILRYPLIINGSKNNITGNLMPYPQSSVGMKVNGDQNMLTGNTISDLSGVGIIIESGSKNGIVGNMLADNSGGAITDNGTGTVKYGNVT